MVSLLGFQISFNALAILIALWGIVLGLTIVNMFSNRGKQDIINEKLHGETAAEKYVNSKKIPKTKYGVFYQKHLQGLFKEGSILNKISSLLIPNPYETERKLNLIDSNLSLEEFCSIKVLSLIAGVVLLLLGVSLNSNKVLLIVGALSLVVSFGLNNQVFGDKIKKRNLEIERDLPNFLDLLYSACKTGHTITNAITEVSSKYTGIISEEFNRAMIDFKSNGGNFKKAMENMIERNDVESLTNVISDILISYEKGDDKIIETLQEEAEAMREIVNADIDEQANKKTTTLMIPMMIAFFLPIMIFLLLPMLSQFMEVMG